MSTAAMPVDRTDAAHARPGDYSLTGRDTALAIEQGLAEADWYQSPVSRDDMRALLARRDGPAIRDTVLYVALLAVSGWLTYRLWGSGWALLPMMAYGVLYASASDARWHEAGHGTAFRTDWMNNALYEVASFLVLRESVPWRWSHTRHHSDTIIVGRDPEIAVPRPPDLREMALKLVNYRAWRRYVTNITLHSLGRVTPAEATFIPPSEYPRVFRRARIYAAIALGVAGACVWSRSWLPLVFVYGPNVYGAWLMAVYGWTQHAALAENVLDHRLNCRTIYMNPVHRFLYWNMNYHTEHHMFPLVPYHQLPRLHALVKGDCPEPYPSLAAAYREIVPAVLRQIREPGWYVRRRLPPTARPVGTRATTPAFVPTQSPTPEGWLDVGPAGRLAREDVMRVDHAHRTFAVYRTADGQVRATDGLCTHGNTHLADGLVTGTIVECPKHNGRFDVVSGEPRRLPVCVALRTHRTKEERGRLWLDVSGLLTSGDVDAWTLEVVENRNVATFIKELVVRVTSPSDLEGHALTFAQGQYLQVHIPAYGEVRFDRVVVEEPYASSWRAHHLFDLSARNALQLRRNYSIAARPDAPDGLLRFNVRIAMPPAGQACDAGAGSSWIWQLAPGDTLTATGPFGTFLIPDGEEPLMYIGGGAGMAPIRSHLSHLFETVRTGRAVTYWYGARSRQELFYEDYFRDLERRFPNFRFHVALSAPLPEDAWQGAIGLVHDVVRRASHANGPIPAAAHYLLCGPPVMVQATRAMLEHEFGVPPARIVADEF